MEEQMQTAPMPEDAAPAVPDYEGWISRVKKLALNLGSYMWELGDLLLEGDCEYNAANFGIESYLLIGSHTPHFWKDVSDQVGLSVAALKLYANVARAFPPAQRFTHLSWTHHLTAYTYEERFEYLAACLQSEGKPHTVRWLEKYIADREGKEESQPRTAVSLEFPEPILQRLKDLAKYYGLTVAEVVQRQCVPVISAYITEQAEKISLNLFEYHDGETWPLSKEGQAKLAPEYIKRHRKDHITIRRIGPGTRTRAA